MSTIPLPDAELLKFAPLHQFSTADYLEMIEKGVLGKDDRVELIDGVIVNMSPQGSQHNYFLTNLNRLLSPLLQQFDVSIQGTLTVAERQVFDPDLMLLRRKPGGFKFKLPEAKDVLLVVEAADSSMRLDQKLKLSVYAATMIPEYWIADLKREVLIVHREPDGGGYKLINNYQGDDTVSPLAAPDLLFAVRQAFD